MFRSCLTLMVFAFFGYVSATSMASLDDEYDFDGLEEDSALSDSVNVTTREEDVSLQETATSLLLAQIEQLKNTVWEKEAEIEKLNTQIESNKSLYAEEKKNLKVKWENEKAALVKDQDSEKAQYEKELTNNRVLIRFLSYRVRNKDNRAKISRDVIQAQNEKLRFLADERKTYQEKNNMFLKQAYLQADEIMRQEKQKTALKEALTIDEGLQQDYCNLTKLLKENTVVNFPSYVALLTKTLTDQTEEINKLR